jgi:hypothetical protein
MVSAGIKKLCLSVLVANPETGSRQGPIDGFFIAYDPAAAAFQAAFVGKGYVSLPKFKAVSRAGIRARMLYACLADIFFYLDVPLFVDVVFVDSKFVFYVFLYHIDFFIRKRSRIICQRDIRFLWDSRNIFQNFFLRFPSLVKIFSAISQASSGYCL